MPTQTQKIRILIYKPNQGGELDLKIRFEVSAAVITATPEYATTL